jgi:hypothetical protein
VKIGAFFRCPDKQPGWVGGPGRSHTTGRINGLVVKNPPNVALAQKQYQAHCQSGVVLILAIKPAPKPGRLLGYLADELIVTSRQPFLDGARALLARGYDPTTPYNMRRANSDALSFGTTTIGHAAGLSVNDSRTRFQKFVPFRGLADEDGEPHRVTTISSQLLPDALHGDDVAISELKATLAEPPPTSPCRCLQSTNKR